MDPGLSLGMSAKMGPWLNGLQYHPVTVCGAGSNPVGPAKTYWKVSIMLIM